MVKVYFFVTSIDMGNHQDPANVICDKYKDSNALSRIA